ncbi:MAG TPA: LEA type 2 family protein [Azospira sp.]|nr:LEA type 2 family protein [Azospira sp.]
MNRRGALLLAAAALLAACATPRASARLLSPDVALAGIELRAAGLREQRWALFLRLRNPNPVELPIESLSFVVELAGEPFASGDAVRPLRVPAGGEAVVELAATTALADLIRRLRALRPGEALDYRIHGSVDAGDHGRYPFSRRGRFDPALPPLPSPPLSEPGPEAPPAPLPESPPPSWPAQERT